MFSHEKEEKHGVQSLKTTFTAFTRHCLIDVFRLLELVFEDMFLL